MYKIRNGEIYDDDQPTGVTAFYTKTELQSAYGWSATTLKRNLKSIEHKIYERDKDGNICNRKKVFSPVEMCIIWNYFGLP